MKKLLALLMLISVFAVAPAPAGVFDSKRTAICHDDDGKWNPQSKDCDPYSCGCLFHMIEDYIVSWF